MSHKPGNGVDEAFSFRRRRDFLGSTLNLTFIAFSYNLYFFIVVGQHDVTISKKRSLWSWTYSTVAIAVSRSTTSPLVKNDRYHLPIHNIIWMCMNVCQQGKAKPYSLKHLLKVHPGFLYDRPFVVTSMLEESFCTVFEILSKQSNLVT